MIRMRQVQTLLDCELEARKELEAIKQRTKISQPRGFSISKDVRNDWDAYLEEHEKLNSTCYLPADAKNRRTD